MSTAIACIMIGLTIFVATAGVEAGSTQTEHLVIEWVDGSLDSEIEAAKADGEKFYAAVRDMLGHEPPTKLTIVLSGTAEQAGERAYPHVDLFGRIILYRFEYTGQSYFTSLAHEMVHAFRFARDPRAEMFFEEGFAEFVALRVDPSLDGFPYYGFPVVVVAGQWIASNEDIPLSELRAKHKALNQPCSAQSYALRSSFFDYLGHTYGDAAVLKMGSQPHAGELSDYPKFFGKDFASLEAEWRESVRAQFEQIPDHQELARRFRKESPIQYQPVCKKGEEF